MKENNKLKIISIIMILICVISIGYAFSYFNKKDDKNINFSVVKNNINKSDEEIALGDTCSTSCSAWNEGKWGSWTCSPGGSNTSKPSSSLSTSVTSYTQNDNITNTQGCNSKGLKNCSSCHSEKKWTRSCSYTCSSCSAGKYLGTDKLCHDCIAGTYSAAGASSCTNCSAGTYSSSAGSSSCSKCSAGTYSAAGASSCTNCAAGTYSSSEGATSCSNCAAGYSSPAGSTSSSSCTKCSAGTYNGTAGSTCKSCSAGTYSSSAGSTSCTKCSAGTYSSSGATSCTTCGKGYISAAGASECTKCGNGKTSNKNHTKCVDPCKIGEYRTDSDSCAKCPKGYKCNDEKKTACEAGSYQNKEGQTSCIKCPAGTYSHDKEYNRVSCLQCSVGHKCPGEGNASQTLCPKDEIQPEPGETKCIKCEGGKTNNPTHTECTCGAGKFENDKGVCEECPVGYYCPDGTKKKICGGSAKIINYYQDEKGKSKCKLCTTGEVANVNRTGCIVAPVESVERTGNINDSSNNLYFAKDEARTDTRYNAVSLFWDEKIANANWIIKGTNFSVNQSGSVSFSGKYSGGDPYDSHTYEVSALTAGNSQLSISNPVAKGSYNIYKCNWSSTKLTDAVYTHQQIEKKSSKVHSGCSFFDDYSEIKVKGKTGYKYGTYWNRCCTVEIPPSDFGGCYGDEPYLGIANKAGWNVYDEKFDLYDAKEKKTYKLKYRYDDIKDAASCVALAQGHKCKKGDLKPSTQTIDAKGCESEDTENPLNMTPVNMEIKSKKEDCSYTENGANESFYTINCTRKIKVGFDYNGNGIVDTIKETFRGLGIKFDVNVNTKVECNATFYPKIWQESYEQVMNRLANIKSRKNPSYTKTAKEAYIESSQKKSGKIWDDYINKLSSYDNIKKDDYTKDTINYLYEQYNLAKDIEAIILAFNSYRNELKVDLNEKMKLGLDYELNEEKDSVVEYKGKVITNTEKLTEDNNTIDEYIKSLTWLKYPKNYSWEQNREIKFAPENLYIEKGGEITTTSTTINGGNKVYVDYFIKTPQKVKMYILVDNLGGNESSVTNNNCEINILKDDIKYRQVDVKNPFINADWKKGENWVNKEFDFTKAIDSATWNKKSKASIVLKAKEISELQASNASYIKSNSNYKPYLGVCEENVNLSNVEKKLCSQISESIK